MAKRQEEKMRLDYELVRALKCAELQQKGFTIYPGSRVAHCAKTSYLYNRYYLRKMLALLKPIVLTFLKSEKFKLFVVDLLEKLSKESDNDLDDKAVEFIKRGLKVE